MSFQLSTGRVLGAVALSIVVLATPAPVQAGQREAPVAPVVGASRTASSTQALPATLQRVLAKVNAARAQRGRRPLRLSGCLTGRVAKPWARHLADIEDLVHRNQATVLRTCPRFHRVGENIASGYPTAAAVMRGWMHSPGHRSNILNRGYRRIGLGVARSSDGTRYWVQNFGG